MKLQFWSFDVVFAITIFVAAMSLLTIIWYNLTNQFALAYGYGVQNMQTQLQLLSFRLINPGNPPNWNVQILLNNTSTWSNFSLGLGTDKNGVLSTSKIMSLMAMANSNYTNYQSTKQLLGVSYNYYIIIKNSAYLGNLYNITIGLNPNKYNAKAIQVTNMPIVLDDGTNANMQVIIWTNTTFGVS